MTYYLNKTDVRGDGRIVLFQRPRADKKTPNEIWQVRISIPLPNTKGYHFSTTNERNISRATQFAMNKFDELYQKIKGGGTLATTNWINLVKEWAFDFPTMQKEPDRKVAYIKHAIAHIRNHPSTFFGKNKNNPKIENITSNDIQEYYSWRRTFNPRPKNSTLKKEAVNINLVLQYAFYKGYIALPIKVNYPKLEDVKQSRHAGFTRGEWRTLTDGMKKWVNENPSSHIKRKRFYLQHYVLIAGSCGARIGELRGLRWQDIERNTTKTANLVAVVDGKNGIRDINFQKTGETYITRLYNYRKKELNGTPPRNEYVFCDPKGVWVHSFRKGFQSLCEELGISHDSRGRKRTIYSLRHFYAVMRLEEEVSPYLLMKQMGTSMEMLEKHYGNVIVKQMSEQITKTRHKGKDNLNDNILPWD
jgi:integrase